MKQNLTILLLIFIYHLSFGQGTVEAEFDTTFHFQFKSLKDTHTKRF